MAAYQKSDLFSDKNRNNPHMGFAAIVGSFLAAFTIAVLAWLFFNLPSHERFDSAFHLVDDEGRPFTEENLKGAPAIMSFGYTRCPEVCPTTLYEMAGWMEALGEDGSNLNAYFFTVDPERDDVKTVNAYANAFSDRITGVTGELPEMRKMIDGWKLYARKVPNGNGGYSMAHSMDVLLVGSDGRLKGLIPYGTSNDVAVQKVRQLLVDGERRSEG
ncbi:SCO family protein [Limoniibacter endophyticus]|uniref:Electron transporter SCO1/SenC n=1 Tax=Limoniibacter endophyticus TaxID=1565040 RepID=A0A8J3DKC7_9HYPH|nr:SCO family protein [Limoniibacter endophyticus]GHC60311.1 electron transporter SCO1/SenC [Limoniibacter endophyticus]